MLESKRAVLLLEEMAQQANQLRQLKEEHEMMTSSFQATDLQLSHKLHECDSLKKEVAALRQQLAAAGLTPLTVSAASVAPLPPTASGSLNRNQSNKDVSAEAADRRRKQLLDLNMHSANNIGGGGRPRSSSTADPVKRQADIIRPTPKQNEW